MCIMLHLSVGPSFYWHICVLVHPYVVHFVCGSICMFVFLSVGKKASGSQDMRKDRKCPRPELMMTKCPHFPMLCGWQFKQKELIFIGILWTNLLFFSLSWILHYILLNKFLRLSSFLMSAWITQTWVDLILIPSFSVSQ